MRIVGADRLKWLGVALLAVMLGSALVEKMLAASPHAASHLFWALLLLSPVAYLVRETCKTKSARKPVGRARERTRVQIADFEED